MSFYCATHQDENLDALKNERLDSLTEHMVVHKAYSLDAMQSIAGGLVIWEMNKMRDGYFHFGQIIPRA